MTSFAWSPQAVRTVFNMAISSDSPDIQRTARNALLQMLNTIVKNVTQFPVVSRDSTLPQAETRSWIICWRHI
jgi:hypothetical protein